jgi:hypothetical protein
MNLLCAAICQISDKEHKGELFTSENRAMLYLSLYRHMTVTQPSYTSATKVVGRAQYHVDR